MVYAFCAGWVWVVMVVGGGGYTCSTQTTSAVRAMSARVLTSPPRRRRRASSCAMRAAATATSPKHCPAPARAARVRWSAKGGEGGSRPSDVRLIETRLARKLVSVLFAQAFCNQLDHSKETGRVSKRRLIDSRLRPVSNVNVPSTALNDREVIPLWA